MTPRRRTQIVRFWLAVACMAVALCWHLYMEALLIPLALLMPAFSCDVFTDGYATDQLATAYSTRSGSFAVASGVLTTSSTGGLLRCETAGTTGHGKSSMQAKADTLGASFRIVGSIVDDSNYLFAELTVDGGSSTFKMFRRTSGTNTQIGGTVNLNATINTYYRLAVCWNGIAANAYWVNGATDITSPSIADQSISATYTGAGNQAGVGASANGGTVTFDDFQFTQISKDQSACFTCLEPCSGCTDGVMPVSGQVDLVGSPSGMATACCDTWSIPATWIVAYTGQQCVLKKSVTFNNCSGGAFTPGAIMTVTFAVGKITVRYCEGPDCSTDFGCGTLSVAVWESTGIGNDCSTQALTSIPLISQSVHGGATTRFTGTTINWTPIA